MVDSESVVECDCVKNKNNKPDGFIATVQS